MTPPQWLFLVGGLVLVTLGLMVGLLRRRLPTALAFAALAVGMGLPGVVIALDRGHNLLVWWPMGVLAIIGLWAFFFVFPRRLARSDVTPAVVTALVAFVLSAVLHATGRWALEDSGFLTTITMTIDTTIGVLRTAGLVAVTLMLPLRVTRMPSQEHADARSLGIVAVGFAMFTAGTFFQIARAARGDIPISDAIYAAAYVILPVLLWLHAARGPHGGVARNVIIASVAVHLSSYAIGLMAFATGRLLGGLLLAYAVLRGHMEGVDIKARFAISRSTIAAAFVAVFFIASEGAQILFGQGNEWVGLSAAGVLVFAIAPLQRAAERLAEKAVPLAAIAPPAGPSAGPPSDALEAAFMTAVRAAIQDGSLTRREEHHLAELAGHLGLSAKRALELRERIEEEPVRGVP